MYLDLKTFCYKDDLKCHNISVKNNTVDFISTCLKHVWINFFNNSMNINAKLPEILFTPKIGPIFILLEMPCKNDWKDSTPRTLTLQSVRAVWFLWWWYKYQSKLPEILFTHSKDRSIFILLEMPCKNNRSGSTPRKLTLQSVRAVWFLWWWHSGT